MSVQPTRREVRVGDETVVIQEPNGYKFLEATELLGEISDAIPDLMERRDKFVRQYRLQTGTRLEKMEARIRYPEQFAPDEKTGDFTDQWWADRGNAVVLPGPEPSTEQVIAAVFGQILKLAKPKAIRMVALFAAPDGQLAEADEKEDVEAYLRTWEKKLLHKGKTSQLVQILGWSMAAMREEFAADGEAAAAVGELKQFFNRNEPDIPTPSEPSPSENLSEDEPPPAAEPTVPPADVPAHPETDDGTTRPTSSTGSPAPSDGTDERSFTDPAGASYVESVPSYASGT